MSKRIVLWHGYLLTGSGSNIYTAALAREWRAAGHDVLLMCQEKQAGAFGFVDAHGDAQPDNSAWRLIPTGAGPAPGRCVVVRPHIAGLLPVYVWDAYEGFEVKRFVDLSDEELERYSDANVRALVTAIELHKPHAIVVGHEVMGPAIARRACEATDTRYLAKLHGSALEYAVKLQARYRHHAVEGLSRAAIVAAGSRYMIDEASSVIPGWKDRAVVVNPGCDVELFRPRPRLDGASPTVGFVGKLIAAKGPQDLIACLGLTSVPQLRAAIVGFGALEQRLRELAGSLSTGDVDRARAIASTGEGGRLGSLLRFLRSHLVDDRYRRRAAEVGVEFLGRLDHAPLSRVLPTFDALVVPSVVPEAFGMVAAEAAACGVLPIVPRHSGIGEVGATLEAELGQPGLLSFDPRRPIEDMALAIDRVLSLSPAHRAELEAAAVELARRRWSWRVVAQKLLALALPANDEPPASRPARSPTRGSRTRRDRRT